MWWEKSHHIFCTMEERKEEKRLDEVVKAEFNRMQDEDKRQNRRIENLERNIEMIQKIALSVEKLAVNMESMVKEQESQGARLQKLEAEPGEQWNTMKRTIFTSIISTMGGGLAVGIMMLIAQNIGR